jgi:glycosyltransferase involved in cell wall biosynthesis
MTSRAPCASAGPGRPPTTLDLAYVVQRYPKVSHVFILREVRALRAAGATVDTYSLQRAAPVDLLTEADREEASRTDALRPVAPGALLRSHLRMLRRSPRGYVHTLRTAVAAAPPGAKARVWQVLYFGQAVLLADRLRRHRARHVHAHLANVATDVVWLAVELLRSRGEHWTWSFTMHGPTEFRDVRGFNLARKVAAADAVVCISDFCRSQLMAVSVPDHWPKLRIVHCGVDVDRFVVTDRSARPPHHLLSVGRLVPEKAQSVLLQAVAELVREGHDVTATIVGDGPERDRLLDQRRRLGLEHRVELPGALGQDDLAVQSARAEIFFLASFDEGVPVVLMEAMARGLPVVGTRIAGIPELIDDGVNGLLVAPGRADLLADAVARLLTDPRLRAELTTSARRTIEDDFNASREAVALSNIFATMSGNAGSAE